MSRSSSSVNSARTSSTKTVRAPIRLVRCLRRNRSFILRDPASEPLGERKGNDESRDGDRPHKDSAHLHHRDVLNVVSDLPPPHAAADESTQDDADQKVHWDGKR